MDSANSNNTSREVWVLGEVKTSGELSPTVFELSAKARELADELLAQSGSQYAVKVILILDSSAKSAADPGRAGQYGADEVIAASGDGLPSDRAASARALAYLAGRAEPEIILASATAFGRAVMPYAAALLETGLTADCTGLAIERESGLLLQTRPAIGGNIMATIKTPGHRPQMATVRPGTFPTQKPDISRAAKVTEAQIPPGEAGVTVETVKFTPFGGEAGALGEREAIVSGGRGLRRAEGFELIERLASSIGAGVGASRPTVEMKWAGYQHQVGLSGQTVSPKVYIAAGISGSVQHLAGMQTSGKIISINRDPDAPIFNVSDVALCGDLYEIIPMLIERIERRKGRER
jgi:electron transfer flavoprotein alpha subunit